jgi:hypothetical protein
LRSKVIEHEDNHNGNMSEFIVENQILLSKWQQKKIKNGVQDVNF